MTCVRIGIGLTGFSKIGKEDYSLEEMKDDRGEKTTCKEATNSNLVKMESSPEEIKSVAVHQEDPKDDRKSEGAKLELPSDENLGDLLLPYIIAGAEAFPLKKYLMKPHSKTGRSLSEAEKTFNYRLSRTRNTVENAFGILANTWRIYQPPFKCNVEHADKVIQAKPKSKTKSCCN
ncbi:hypothetical protein B7P43_G16661 [Cryptotermes secundus]|uniref:DDE Tnp4 domain-containing protein n=1 Tax=Cryptotermes secundus TaxID=105785 RepID=A0A2J7R966_9NEOP|nr:hypothetical protein B7P43_G16661 [Cryptotermes secundus]